MMGRQLGRHGSPKLPIGTDISTVTPTRVSMWAATHYLPILPVIIIFFFLMGCATLSGTTPETATAPGPDNIGLIQESPNPYIRDTIITHASLPFEPLGKSFPFYRTPFWDTFSVGHYELRVTPEDERPNCLGGVQMNYPKWIIALAREFGYTNAVEMLYWGVVLTDVMRGRITLTWTGNLESSMRKARHRDFYSFYDYMNLNYAEFSWIYFERVYGKRWIVAMKNNPETGLDAFAYWKQYKKEFPVRVRLPQVDSFQYIPREGDIVVGLYNQTNYPTSYISHIMFCVKGGDNPVFAEQLEEYGYFSPYSNLIKNEFDYGLEAIIRPFYPVDASHFDEFVKTPLSAYNEPIPDGSIFLAPKAKIRQYLLETMRDNGTIEAVDGSP
ncbi:MAG: hypothetical protein JW765_09880 [Deltaproteobacteria bacterium]|nr:hypothetical protein [Candidatus Zymogenaceae bacterium]